MPIKTNLCNAVRRTWHCRLCWLATLGVFVSIIFIEALILGPSAPHTVIKRKAKR